MDKINFEEQMKLDCLLNARLQAQQFQHQAGFTLQAYQTITIAILRKIVDEADSSKTLEEFTIKLRKSLETLNGPSNRNT